MTTARGDGDTALRERVTSSLGRGQRCASCFVQVLEEEGVELPPQVAALAPALEWGLGRSGAVCGVFVAAVLGKAVQQSAGTEVAGEEPPVPTNEWLDAFTPFPSRVPDGDPCARLGRRLTAFAKENYGGLECNRIAGVDYPGGSPALAALYFAEGGDNRCVEFIIEAARAFGESDEPS